MVYMKHILEEAIKKALISLGLTPKAFVVEHPVELSHGDYATSVALSHSKEAGTSPRELAEKLKAELEKNIPEGVKSLSIAGPGFINFHLSGEFFKKTIEDIKDKKSAYGRNIQGKEKKVLVEYSSPNIAKPFTVGHLRSTIIGDSLANIFEFSGYTVIRDNHLGDWGTQFGKLIVAVKKWGDIEKIKTTDEDTVKSLVSLYVKFHDEAEKNPELEDEARAWFTKLENGDGEARALWQIFVELSMKEFNQIYARLSIHKFDTLHGESFFEDKMQTIVDDVKAKNLGTESEGAYLVFFDELKKMPPLMLLKKDGSSLYALRDLAADKWRLKEYGENLLIINEVGAEQSQYFKQIFEVEKMLGYVKENQRIHVGHGLYRFKDGKMSTRKGNVIWLDDILNEAEKRAGDINKETAKEVALGAIKFNDLRRESSGDIVFDWDEMLNINGDSGPYIQYTYARIQSILTKAQEVGIYQTKSCATTELPSEVERLLYRFPEIVEESLRFYAPHHIATYLLELTRAFNSYYGSHKILDLENREESSHRVSIAEAVSIIIKNGLGLLGISTIEKM